MAEEEVAQLRAQLRSMETMVLQYAAITMEARLKSGSAVMAHPSGETSGIGEAEGLKSLRALHEAIAASQDDSIRPRGDADGDRSIHGWHPLGSIAARSPGITDSAAKARSTGAGGELVARGGEDASAYSSAATSGAVQKELARLRLRDGLLEQKLHSQRADAEAAKREAMRQTAVASDARSKLVASEEALRHVREELTNAMRNLAHARRETEHANAQAAEWRRRQESALAESAEAQHELMAANDGWRREKLSHEQTQSQLREHQSALFEAQRRAAEAEAARVDAEAEAALCSSALPQWHEKLQRAETQLRVLSAQLREKEAVLRAAQSELTAAREESAAAKEKIEALRGAHERFVAESQAAKGAAAAARAAEAAARGDGGAAKEAAAARAELAALKEEHAALSRDHAQLRSDRQALHDRWSLLSASNEELRLELSSTRSQLIAAREQASARRGSAAAAAAAAGAVHAKALELGAELEGRSAFGAVEGAAGERTMVVAAETERRLSAENKLEEQMRSQDEARKRLAAMEEELSALQSSRSSDSVQLRQLRQQLASQQEEARREIEAAAVKHATELAEAGRRLSLAQQHAENERALSLAAISDLRKQLSQSPNFGSKASAAHVSPSHSPSQPSSPSPSPTLSPPSIPTPQPQTAPAGDDAGSACAPSPRNGHVKAARAAIEAAPPAAAAVRDSHRVHRSRSSREQIEDTLAFNRSCAPACSPAAATPAKPAALSLSRHTTISAAPSPALFVSPTTSTPGLSSPSASSASRAPLVDEATRAAANSFLNSDTNLFLDSDTHSAKLDDDDDEPGARRRERRRSVSLPSVDEREGDDGSPEASTRRTQSQHPSQLSDHASRGREAAPNGNGLIKTAANANADADANANANANANAAHARAPPSSAAPVARGLETHGVVLPSADAVDVLGSKRRSFTEMGAVSAQALEDGVSEESVEGECCGNLECEIEGGVGQMRVSYAALTHVGGSGTNAQKQNQDAFFCARCGAQTMVWGVLDGHGSENGRMVSAVAARGLRLYFEQNPDAVAADPQQAMRDAFEAAHERVRAALLARYRALGQPLKQTAEGFLVGSDGQPIDGGTTATVVALIKGKLLVVANAGDSEAILGGRVSDGSVGFEALCGDHAPTNVDEFIRVAKLAPERPADWQPALFAYDLADHPWVEIFSVSETGEVDLDGEAAALVDAKGVGFKTARGDRPTALVSLETDDYVEVKLGMTRALGDFYMEWYGCTWEPTVSAIDLLDVSSQLDRVTLVIGSDGLWDLWEYSDVLALLLQAPPADSGQEVLSPLSELVESTRQQGEELFEETADNITAIVATFDIVKEQR